MLPTTDMSLATIEMLPVEIWQLVFMMSSLRDALVLRQVCARLNAIGHPLAPMWTTHALRVVGVDVKLAYETHFDVCIKSIAWTTLDRRLRVTRGSASATRVNMATSDNGADGQTVSLAQPTRAILAESVSHACLVRWTKSAPLVYFHLQPLLAVVRLGFTKRMHSDTNQENDSNANVTVAQMQRLVLDPSIQAMRFVYAIPHSQWVVFKDSLSDALQLGHVNPGHTRVCAVESSQLRFVINAVEIEVGAMGMLLPLRGHGDSLVLTIRLSNPPRLYLVGIALALASEPANSENPSVNGQLSLTASVKWRCTVPRVQQVYADNHAGYLILRESAPVKHFRIIRILDGHCATTEVMTNPQYGPFIYKSTIYKSWSDNAHFVTCSRFHSIAAVDSAVKIANLAVTDRVTSVHPSLNPASGTSSQNKKSILDTFTSAFLSQTQTRAEEQRRSHEDQFAQLARHTVSPDASLLAAFHTQTRLLERESAMRFEFTMQIVDVMSGVVQTFQAEHIERHRQEEPAPASGSAEGRVWVVYSNWKGEGSAEQCVEFLSIRPELLPEAVEI
ncbi:hypothetical protein BJ741DRAFT_598251 [Chytriomyces cf. hyalinus JEL632]|nr:hypothetical protein BJ741DRAFT_598251 [Chytriomyces cf. hyalinus JEL632]